MELFTSPYPGIVIMSPGFDSRQEALDYIKTYFPNSGYTTVKLSEDGFEKWYVVRNT